MALHKTVTGAGGSGFGSVPSAAPSPLQDLQVTAGATLDIFSTSNTASCRLMETVIRSSWPRRMGCRAAGTAAPPVNINQQVLETEAAELGRPGSCLRVALRGPVHAGGVIAAALSESTSGEGDALNSSVASRRDSRWCSYASARFLISSALLCRSMCQEYRSGSCVLLPRETMAVLDECTSANQWSYQFRIPPSTRIQWLAEWSPAIRLICGAPRTPFEFPCGLSHSSSHESGAVTALPALQPRYPYRPKGRIR